MRDDLAEGSMLYKAEKSCGRVSVHVLLVADLSRKVTGKVVYTYHDAEAQTQRYGEKDIAVLYSPPLFPRELTNDDIHTYKGRSADAGCGEVSCGEDGYSKTAWMLTDAAQSSHDPPPAIITYRHADTRSSWSSIMMIIGIIAMSSGEVPFVVAPEECPARLALTPLFVSFSSSSRFEGSSAPPLVIPATWTKPAGA